MYEQAHKAAAFNITQTTGSTVNAYACLHMDGAVCSRLRRSSALDSAGGICASGRHGPVLVFTNCKMSFSLFKRKACKQLASLTQTTTTHHRMGRWTDNQAGQPRLGLRQPVRAVG